MRRDEPGSVRATAFLNATWQVARKEVQQHIRTKRLLIIGGLIVFALVMVTIVFGPPVARNFGDITDNGNGSLGATENLLLVAFLTILGFTFIQLLPIVLTADAVCSEWSSRTIFLLLSKPVSRTAFVLGKFLGSVITVVATLVLLLGLDYLVMQPLYAGTPHAADVWGFVQFLGFVCVGCLALSALALFFSTVTRSTAIAILLTLGVWLIAFTFIGFAGELISLGSKDHDRGVAQAFHYVDPAYDMRLGMTYLIPGSHATGGTEIVAAGAHPWIGLLALVGHTVVWFGGALLIVQKRNFE